MGRLTSIYIMILCNRLKVKSAAKVISALILLPFVTEGSVMEYGQLCDAGRHDLSSPAFQAAFAFLKRTDLAELPVGQIELGHGVCAHIQHYCTVSADSLDFETHGHFFDIQYVVAGEEKIGITTRVGLTEKIPTARSETSPSATSRKHPVVFIFVPVIIPFSARRMLTSLAAVSAFRHRS